MATAKPANHPPVKPPKIGVLLLNLGTPDATDYWTVRRYLKEFLSDRRVIDTNPLLWWPILNLAILSFRPQKSGHAYAKIWDREANDSPLRVITRRQAENLQQRFAATPQVLVDFAMRYGKPSTEERLRAMQAADASFTDRVLGASPTPFTGQPVNPDAEIGKRASRRQQAPKPKNDSGGWFDWLF